MFSAIGKACAKALPSVLADVVGLAAVGAISYGSWLVYPPAGFIVAGTLALAGVLLAHQRDK